MPQECLQFLWNKFQEGREPIVAIRPLNRWSRYSLFPDGALSYVDMWNECIVGHTGDLTTESNACLHMHGLQWRYYDSNK